MRERAGGRHADVTLGMVEALGDIGRRHALLAARAPGALDGPTGALSGELLLQSAHSRSPHDLKLTLPRSLPGIGPGIGPGRHPIPIPPNASSLVHARVSEDRLNDKYRPRRRAER